MNILHFHQLSLVLSEFMTYSLPCKRLKVAFEWQSLELKDNWIEKLSDSDMFWLEPDLVIWIDLPSGIL